MAETSNLAAVLGGPDPGRTSVSTDGRPSHDQASQLPTRSPYGVVVDGSLEWYSPEFASLTEEQQSLPRTTAFMVVRNSGNKSLMFKVKTTNPKVFRVQPKDGYLKAGEKQEIQISVIDKPKTSRFRIVYMHDLPRQVLKGATISDYITKMEKEASADQPVPFVPFNYGLSQNGHSVLMPGSGSRQKASREPADESVLSAAGDPTFTSNDDTTPTASRPQSIVPAVVGLAGATSSGKIEPARLSDEGIRQRSVPLVAEPVMAANDVSSLAKAWESESPLSKKASAAVADTQSSLAFGAGSGLQSNTQEVPLRIAAILCLISFLIGYIL